MRLWYGHPARPVRMSATEHCHSDRLCERLMSLAARNQLLWLQVENQMHALYPPELRLAAEIAASYHNQICHNVPPDDGWQEETEAMEQRAEMHMLAPDSDASDGDEAINY